MSKTPKKDGGALIEHIEDWRRRNPAAAAAASHFDPSTARQRSTWPIGLEQIAIGPRLREVDEAVVARLAESMDRIGLQNPIQVRHNFGIDPDTGEYERALDQGGFALVAGAHRIEAARRLGWGRIEALVLDEPSPDVLALVEVDENLARAELTPLHRGRFVARREELHKTLYPNARHGGDRKSAEYREKIKTERFDLDLSRSPSFVEETADLTSMSKGTVERALRIGKQILPELQDELEGTPIARREGDLYRLAGLSEGQQLRALEKLREADEPPAKLSALLQKDTPPEPPASPTRAQQFSRLETAWSQIAPHDQVTALERLCLLMERRQRDRLLEALHTRHGAARPTQTPEEGSGP